VSELERRYRRVLRLLPAAYRGAWEEEMVATLLARMATDDPEEAEYRDCCGRPPRSEVASIVGLAVRLRLGGMDAPPRSRLWGQAVRLAAVVALLAFAVPAARGGWQLLWHAGWLPWPALPADVMDLTHPWAGWQVAGTVAWLPWVFAYLALVAGRRRWAGALAGLGLLMPFALDLLLAVATPDPFPPTSMPYTWLMAIVATGVVVLALVAGFHRDAPPLRPGPWLLALAAGVAADTAVTFLALGRQVVHHHALDLPGMWSIALVVVGGAHLAASGRRRPARAPEWALALALLAATLLVLRVVSLVEYTLTAGAAFEPGLAVLHSAQAVAVLAVGLPLAVRAARSVGAAPRVPPAAAAPTP